jgi:hypothetical protein
MRMAVLKLVIGASLAFLFSLPLAADTLHSHQFTPDRDERSHRDMSQDSDQSQNNQNNVIQNSGNLFRPGRNSFINLNVEDDDDVVLPSDQGDIKTANNPTAPDAPADPVPEPGTFLLIAPAALGVLNKFRR